MHKLILSKAGCRFEKLKRKIVVDIGRFLGTMTGLGYDRVWVIAWRSDDHTNLTPMRYPSDTRRYPIDTSGVPNDTQAILRRKIAALQALGMVEPWIAKTWPSWPSLVGEE
jgi:hypothetical protein